MAATRLSDLIIATEVFTPAMLLESLRLDAFVQSGVAVEDPTLNEFLNSAVGGKTVSPRFIGPLTQDDANVSSDDPSSTSTPKSIPGLKNTAVRQSLNQSWGSMDLVARLHGSDPLAALLSLIAKYWVGERQKRVVASLRGVLADNVANDSGDMVNDISGESGASALFGGDAFVDTKLTLGDKMGGISAIAVHSVVYATMLKNDLIAYAKDSEGKETIPMYQGAFVVVDDNVDVVAGSPTKYYNYLFGPGAIAFGAGQPKVPLETFRNPNQGNGGGEEELYSRTEWIIHPQGFQCSLTDTPTIAQLRLAGSWDRAFERKRIPFACLMTAG